MLESLKQQCRSLQGNHPLSSLRHQGWQRFETLGFPSKKQEAYRYLPLSRLQPNTIALAEEGLIAKEDILPHIQPSALHSYLVFINGFFRPDLSDLTGVGSQVQSIPLSQAIQSHGPFLNHRLSKAISGEEDAFAALNAAAHGEGAFFYIPPKLRIDQPIQCLYIQTSEGFSSPRIHLFLGKEAQATWIATSAGMGSLNAVVDVALEEGAQLDLFSQIKPASERWYIEALRVSLKRNSRFSSISLSSGEGYARQDARIMLAEEGADARLQGLSVLKEKGQSHAYLVVEHAAPHTQSMQHYKTLLDHTSQTSFEGKIYVHQEAQKTQAYQLNNNLLLDDRAIANSKPNLEIFADDVKASHGVTVSQLDRSLLFYLQTRGIGEKEAKALLTHGYCQEILGKIPFPFLAEEIEMRFNTPLQ
jgi:Fe-S cluster assembly protein SufD